MESQSEDSSRHILSTDDLINPLTVLLFLALLIIFNMLVSSGIILLLESWYGLPLESAFEKLKQENSPEIRNYIRVVLVINHLFIFILPGLFVALFIYKKSRATFLGLNFKPPLTQSINSLLGVFLITASFPLAQLALRINRQIPLPDWVKNNEASTNAILQNLLGIQAPSELFLNLTVIALIPAFGEELLFRGILQRNFERFFQNPHTAIWLTAILFSAFHMQFEGFLPRMLLGAMLGYIFYWSGSLWVPVISHFVYNALQILAIYLYSNKMSAIDIEQIDHTPVGLFIISIIFVLTIGYFFIQFNHVKPEKVE